MDDALRHSLADRAFLFDDPDAYLAGVDAALRAIAEVEDADRARREDQRPVRPSASA